MPDINREYAEPKLDWKIEKPGEHWTVEHESGSKLSVKLAVAGYTLTVETGEGPPVEHSIGSMAAHFLGAAERLYERFHSASVPAPPRVEVRPEPSSTPAPRAEVRPEVSKPEPRVEDQPEAKTPEPPVVVQPEANEPTPTVEVQPDLANKLAPIVEVQPAIANKPAPSVEVQPDVAHNTPTPAGSSTEKTEPSGEPFIIMSDEPKAEGSGA